MFTHAVRDRLLQTSPFSDIKGGSESNTERHHFIDLQTAEQVLAACPDEELKLVFALARFGGLRCQSEVVALKWSDIDWKNDRFRIAQAKTPTRFCPLFPEIRSALQAAHKVAANRWLGHGRKVAEKHYLQITEEHWSKASDFRSLTGSLTSSKHETSRNSTEMKKTQQFAGSF